MGRPLFILGKQRSGTTWLANQLGQHSQIAAVCAPHHGGVHESAFFSHVAGRYGDLSRKTNYVELVEVMAASDTLNILGIDKSFLYALWPTTYEGVFRAVMERAAERKGARYWLDKTPEHTLLTDRLAAHYPDAKFVAITRNAYDVMGSTIGRYRGGARERRVALVRGTLNLVAYSKEITRFARRSEGVRVVRFADLKREPEAVFRDLCSFLGLEFETIMLHDAYRPNTTFRTGYERAEVLSRYDRQLIAFALGVGRVVPTGGFRALRRATRAARRPLPSWFFSMYGPAYERQPYGQDSEQRT